MGNRFKAHLALIGTNVFFAINFTAVKFLINGHMIKPFGLNLIRMLITSAMLWIMYLLYPISTKIRKEDRWRFLVCALTGIVINQLLFIKGLSLTYSIHASLLMLGTPIFITILSAILLKEKITALKWIGLSLGIIGSSMLIVYSKSSGSAGNIIWGDILVIINAISYSFYFIMVKPLMRKYHPIRVTRIIFTIGSLIALPFCWNEFSATPLMQYGITEWMVLALIVIGGTFFAYTFNIFGIKHLGPSVAGSYIYSQPVFAALIAMIVLGESLDAYKILAGVFIFSGVYLANKKIKND